jgi:hypothetical protein
VNKPVGVLYIIGWFAVFGLMAGCALNPAAAPVPVAIPSIAVEIKDGVQWPDNDLPSRFQQYWTLRKAGDAAAAFEYEAPHVREMVIWGRYEGYSKHARKDWLSIHVEKINKITDQLIDIEFNMVAKNREKEGGKRDIYFRDSWLLISGQWFHVLKDPFVTGDGLGK